MQPNQLPRTSLAEAVGVDAAASARTDDGTAANLRNWIECIRSRRTPNADIEAGYNHSVALCMTIAAIQTGCHATFDDVRQKVVVGRPDPRAPAASAGAFAIARRSRR